jgi:hypothetical protein
MLAMSLPLP